MKTKWFVTVFIIVVIGLLFQPGCKKSWEFSILGTWNFTINTSLAWNPQFAQILTFSGSISSGTVSGWTYDPGEIGSYTVTGANVSIVYNYLCVCGSDMNWTFNATASETNENFLGGTGSGHHLPGGTWTMTWTAIRL